MKSFRIEKRTFKKIMPGVIQSVILSGFLVLTSCHTTIIETAPQKSQQSDQSAAVAKEPVYTKSYVSLALGIYEYSTPDYVLCKGGVKMVKMQRDILDTAIHFFVGGIFTTRHAKVYCNE